MGRRGFPKGGQVRVWPPFGNPRRCWKAAKAANVFVTDVTGLTFMTRIGARSWMGAVSVPNQTPMLMTTGRQGVTLAVSRVTSPCPTFQGLLGAVGELRSGP